MSVEIFAQAVAAHGAGALEAAEQGYRDVLAQDPDHSGALANLGRLARQRGDLAEAIALYARAAEGDAPAEVHFNLGCALWDSPDRKIRLDVILASFERAIALRADFRAAWVKRAEVVAGTDNPKAAFAAWNAAATALPDDKAMAIEAGKAALDAGLVQLALPLLRRGAQDPARRRG